MNIRKIAKIVNGKLTTDGAGVSLRRIFSYSLTKELDPFLLLDYFYSTNPNDYIKGFPWHPHRGIETVTYLLDGEIEHGDSLGNTGTITSGSCQWMTAGSGILHQEMPQPSKLMHGIQLWINLPKKSKMISPKYRDIKAEKIQSYSNSAYTLKAICGNYKKIKGIADDIEIKPIFFDIKLNKNNTFNHTFNNDDTVFAIILKGKGRFAPDSEDLVDSGNIVLFNKGESVSINTYDEDLRFFLLAGKPLKEPIAWRGPIVMNSESELDQAYNELSNNTFIK
jgi:redox-sensitive bicupin YhaK (pirin superfamily)